MSSAENRRLASSGHSAIEGTDYLMGRGIAKAACGIARGSYPDKRTRAKQIRFAWASVFVFLVFFLIGSAFFFMVTLLALYGNYPEGLAWLFDPSRW